MSEIEIGQVRESSYEDAEREIMEYVMDAGNRKVHVSEIAEELLIDFDLVEEVMEELSNRPL